MQEAIHDKQNELEARQVSAEHLANILEGYSKGTTKDQRLRFAIAWIDKERRVTHLADAAGISKPTAARWRDIIKEGRLAKQPLSKREVVAKLAQAFEDTPIDDPDSLGKLADRLMVLEGWKEPERQVIEQLSVVAHLQAGATPQDIDRLIAELAQELQALGLMPDTEKPPSKLLGGLEVKPVRD